MTPTWAQLLTSNADEVDEMQATALRQAAPRRFRRGPSRRTVEELTARITELAAERQALRARGADAAALERNRVRIARSQWELSHALIERHGPRESSAFAGV
jgi:hypothetical protein